MAFIEPFRGIRYAGEFSHKMSDIITLPYDKIDPQKREAYIKRNPYNFVNLILNEHKKSKELLEEWLKRGILVRDEKPSLYFYIQQFLHPFTQKPLRRKGIITLIKLEDFGKNIYPHEKTLKKPKEDRLNLLRKTQANFGQIFMLYEDKEDNIMSFMVEYVSNNSPVYDFDGAPGTHHTLWKIEDREIIEKIKDIVEDKKLFIADGHHRYEVSNIYRKEMKEKIDLFEYPENPDFVMGTLVNVYDESIVILPTHRYVKVRDSLSDFLDRWSRYFVIKQIDNMEKLRNTLEENLGKHAIGVHLQDKYYLFISKLKDIEKFFDKEKSKKWNMLDVNILHRVIIDNLNIDEIKFFRTWENCIKEKSIEDNKTICFFLNPTEKLDLLEIAKRLEKMPQKSTDFYPKLPSGLVINKMVLKNQEP